MNTFESKKDEVFNPDVVCANFTHTTIITKHINNVFKEGELDEKSNVHFLHITNSDSLFPDCFVPRNDALYVIASNSEAIQKPKIIFNFQFSIFN